MKIHFSASQPCTLQLQPSSTALQAEVEAIKSSLQSVLVFGWDLACAGPSVCTMRSRKVAPVLVRGPIGHGGVGSEGGVR